MKRMICEVCGGSDILKDKGAFVCQSCGCKHSLEEARKLLEEDNSYNRLRKRFLLPSKREYT